MTRIITEIVDFTREDYEKLKERTKMSYNVISFKLTGKSNLTIDAGYLLSGLDLEEMRKRVGKGKEVVTPESTLGAEVSQFYGLLDDDNTLHITRIAFYGSFSGSSFSKLENVLRQTRGKARAIVVWEDGEVEAINIDNGKLTKEALV